MTFITNNSGFTCKKCKSKVTPHPCSSRNHCTQCLYSLHIDELLPGDRKSKCFGLMEPIFIEQKKQNFIITHKCLKCGHIMKNITAEDDNMDEIIKLTKKSNILSESSQCPQRP